MKVSEFFERFGEKGPAKQCEIALKEFYLDDFNIWDELYYSAKNKLFKDLTLKIMFFKAKNQSDWRILFCYTSGCYTGKNQDIHEIAFEKTKEKSNIEDWLLFFLTEGLSDAGKEAFEWLINFEDFDKLLPKKYTAGEWLKQSHSLLDYRAGEELNLLIEKMSKYATGTNEVWSDFYDHTDDERLKRLILKKIED